MTLCRDRTGLTCICLAVSLFIAGCGDAGPIFVPVFSTPQPFESLPPQIPVTASPQAVSPEPVESPEAARSESDLTTSQPGGRSPLPTPGAAALPTETPVPFGPQAVAYELGDFAIPQPGNASGDMPARLKGLVALPEGPGPYPVVIILHDAGFGCPPADDTQTTWPCGETEQSNYTGFDYLASALAARGYIALVPDINAQYEVAYGEPHGFNRLIDLVYAHLTRLAAANRGEEASFGADLAGRADLGRTAIVAHGRSGTGALQIAVERQEGADAPEIASGRPTIGAVLLVAPEGLAPDETEPETTPVVEEPAPDSSASSEASASPVDAVPQRATLPDVPLGIILPACDGIVPELNGQQLYEAARLDSTRERLAAAVFLFGANHNAFNRFLEADDAEAVAANRPGCDPADELAPAQQRDLLANYAADFLDAVLAAPGAATAARRAGLDAALPAPGALYGYRALTSLAVPPYRSGDKERPASGQLRLLAPTSTAEISTNLLGGANQIVGPPVEVAICPGAAVTATLCAAGFHPPGGSLPSLLRLSWQGSGGLYQLDLPSTAADLTPFAALSLRVAVDPGDGLNAPGEPQSFSVVLRDAAGGAAVVAVPASTPALAYPPGILLAGDQAALWSSFTPLSTVRIPLSQFEGADLTQVLGLAFSFDGPESGSLMVADVEFVMATVP